MKQIESHRIRRPSNECSRNHWETSNKNLARRLYWITGSDSISSACTLFTRSLLTTLPSRCVTTTRQSAKSLKHTRHQDRQVSLWTKAKRRSLTMRMRLLTSLLRLSCFRTIDTIKFLTSWSNSLLAKYSKTIARSRRMSLRWSRGFPSGKQPRSKVSKSLKDKTTIPIWPSSRTEPNVDWIYLKSLILSLILSTQLIANFASKAEIKMNSTSLDYGCIGNDR